MSEFIKDDFIADRVLFAADEIKRLRAEVAQLRAELNRREHIFVDYDLRQKIECAKLRAVLERIADAPNGYAQQYARAALEETK